MTRAESGFSERSARHVFYKRQMLMLDIGIRDAYRDGGAY